MVSELSMLCYKLQSLGGKCPNSALKLKLPLSSIFDKLIAGLLISLCSFRVLPGDCSVDGFFAKRRPCLTAVSLHLLVSMSLPYAHSVPSAPLLNINLSFCLFIRHSVVRKCEALDSEIFFAKWISLYCYSTRLSGLILSIVTGNGVCCTALHFFLGRTLYG